MKKIIVWITVALLLTLIGCESEETSSAVDVKSVITPVEVMTPISGSVSNDTIVVGKLEAKAVAHVSAKLAGMEDILQVNVDVGDPVEVGDVLVVIDSEATADQIEASRLSYITARSNYEALAESIASAKSNLARTQELYDSGVASTQQLESAKLQASDGQLKTVESQLSQSLFAYENIKKSLDNSVLVSPIKGIVSAMDFKEYNMATGQSSITITDMTALKINLYVTENIINKINKDSKVLIEIASASKALVKSNIDSINPVADVRTGLYAVVINIENKENLLKPGMFARVYLTLENSDFAMLLPIDSVMSDDKGTYVYTAFEDKVGKKYVEIGIDNGEVVEILKGLVANDLVVIKGQNYINEASDIRVVVGGN